MVDLTRPPASGTLPRSLLYATSARIGGTGLDVTSHQGALAAQRAGFLHRMIGYGNQQEEIPSSHIRSLRASPVRLLSFLPSQKYYAAKKWYVDQVAARTLSHGSYDCFHGWSGDCLQTLIAARQKDIPTLIDIPTWHRNKGNRKPFITKSERENRSTHWGNAFRVTRQRVLTEYELADVILVPSERAAETFLDVGTPPGKLFYVGRGVDPDHYRPADKPPLFRLVFVGALIRRKGVHHLLKAWKKLALDDAELVLIGNAHSEIREDLKAVGSSSVRVTGFTPHVVGQLRRSTAFVFPSECEGFAKATLEAAACGLPLIATRESGDAVVDGETGLTIPPNDPGALADAIRHLYDHPEKISPMGEAARQRVLEHFTWDHYRARLLKAYVYARDKHT